jgi:hypothetical protein
MHELEMRTAATTDQADGFVSRAPTQTVLSATPGNGPAWSLSGDILHGADTIAEFLFGDRKHRRKVYNLVETGQIPVFRLGANICARKSVLLDWIARQETAASKSALRNSPPEPSRVNPA